MPRKRSKLPKLCLQADRYYIRIEGRKIYLGTDERKAEQERMRLIQEWQHSGIAPKSQSAPSCITITDLWNAYIPHIREHYRKPNGRPTSEQKGIRQAIRALRRLYGHLRADDFTVTHLEAVRDSIIDKGTAKDPDELIRKQIAVGCNRAVTNQHIGRIVRMFKWGARKKLVNASVWHELSTLEPLQQFRTRARESEDVLPAPVDSIAAVIEHASPVIAAMVQIQMFTGCRPGEVCQMRPCDIYREGEYVYDLPVPQGYWVYVPQSHKTEHHGHKRVIPIDARAQVVLTPFLERDVQKPCFTPAESLRWYIQQRWGPDRKDNGRSKAQWDEGAYNKAILLACKKAKVQPFSANQLRHYAATYFREQFGWDAARQLLGHSTLNTTQIYVQEDWSRLMEQISKPKQIEEKK